MPWLVPAALVALSGAWVARAELDTNAWTHVADVTCSGYSGAALSGFPLLLTLGPATVAGFDYADFAFADGRDLRFAAADGTEWLAHDVEEWNTNGASRVWVRLPALAPGAVVRAFWGNPESGTPAAGSAAWDGDFVGVWHFTGHTRDATANGNHATAAGGGAATGRVADGYALDGNDYLDCGNAASVNFTGSAVTLSAWIRPESTGAGQTIIGKSYHATHASPYYTWILYLTGTGGLHCRIDTTSFTAGSVAFNQWQHVAAVYDGAAIRLYLNGRFLQSTPKTGAIQLSARNVRLGGRDTSPLGEYYRGTLDEVRLARTARSADWLLAETLNVLSNATFCSYGPARATNPGLPRITTGAGVADVLATRATLGGNLVREGHGPTQVWVCWGNEDAGDAFGAWDTRVELGPLAEGAFSHPATGLAPGVPLAYRCMASNRIGRAWSPALWFTPAYPRLTVEHTTVEEGDLPATPAEITVRLTPAYGEDVAFTYATADGTATAAAPDPDFIATTGTRTIRAGETQATVPITLLGDRIEEPDETFYLRLLSASNAVIAADTGRCLILSDDRTHYLSPSAVVIDAGAGRLYVADETGARVDVILLTERRLEGAIPLPAHPTGLALDAAASRLYATAGTATGRVCVIDTQRGELLATFEAGHSPTAPVLSPDGATLYVCNRFENRVTLLDTATGAVRHRVGVAREPCAAVLSPDGARLYVANLLPAGPATGVYIGAVVSVIDTASATCVAEIALPTGSHSLRGIAGSPDGRHLFVAHLLSRYQIPTTQVLRGWMNTAALSVLDAATLTRVNTVLLDDIDQGAANPWGVACAADGSRLCVTHAGTHELSVIDLPALLTKLQTAGAGTPNDLAFLATLRRRIPLPGRGPRGVAVQADTAWVALHFDDAVCAVGLAPDAPWPVPAVPLGWKRPLTAERQGELSFNDASLCLQQWQSCASCHPDARTDALNWDLLNDGFGNPKNTRSMLLAHATPPAMISGIRANAETAVRAGLRFIQFVNRPESDALPVDAYLKSLRPAPSPHLVAGAPSTTAQQGAAHFVAAGCAVCHSGPYFTNQKPYNVGTGEGREAGWLFDTPTLIEAWRTAPYLYDGRAATLRDVLTRFNPQDRHGVTSNLSSNQIDELEAYLLSL